MTRIRPSRSHAAARLASFVLATSHLTLAQQATPRPTYKPRDSSWDYDDDGGPTTGDYVVTFIAIAIGMLVVACLFRALGHFILQSAVRARTQAWHAHSPHSPHSLRRASMRGPVWKLNFGRPTPSTRMEPNWLNSTQARPPRPRRADHGRLHRNSENAQTKNHPVAGPGDDRRRAGGQRLSHHIPRPPPTNRTVLKYYYCAV